MRLTDEERRETRSKPFPLQIAVHSEKSIEPGPPSIPWSVADKAYCTYARRYGTQQSVERLSQRGGFSLGEMDDLYPAWRDEVSEISRLSKECDELRKASPDDLRALGWAVVCHDDYRWHGINYTFWSFTKGREFIKGEGRTDAKALNKIREALAAIEVEVADDVETPATPKEGRDV